MEDGITGGCPDRTAMEPALQYVCGTMRSVSSGGRL